MPGRCRASWIICGRRTTVYKNPFGTEIALFRTSEGGMSRMAVSWDSPGTAAKWAASAGQRGSMTGKTYDGRGRTCPTWRSPPLPPSVDPGGTAARTAT